MTKKGNAMFDYRCPGDEEGDRDELFHLAFFVEKSRRVEGQGGFYAFLLICPAR